MEQRKFKVTFAKVTALLCALTALVGTIVFMSGDLGAEIRQYNQSIEACGMQILEQEGWIAQLEANIQQYKADQATLQGELVAANTSLETAEANVAKAKQELQKAEVNLDAVCYRSYYSYWSCTEACSDLHTKVSEKQTLVQNAEGAQEACQDVVDELEYEISDLDNDIAEAEGYILTAKAVIDELKRTIAELRAELTSAWAIVVLKVTVVSLAVGGLALLAKSCFCETVDKLTLFGCMGLAACSFMQLILGAVDNVVWEYTPILYLVTSPHTWGLTTMTLLILVQTIKPEKAAWFRIFAVVAAVIMNVFGALSGNALTCTLYASAAICVAFVIVPLVFTEYIHMAKHIFLSLITAGIWTLVWVYHVSLNLNKVSGVDKRTPALEVIFCMFLPFYYSFWLLKTAEYVEAYGNEQGKAFKLDMACLAMAFVCPLFATVLIQNKINVVVGKPVAEPVAVEAE